MLITNTSGRYFPYLTTTEVGRQVGRHGRTIQKYCEQGLLPFVGIGSGKRGWGLILIHEEDIKVWLAGTR